MSDVEELDYSTLTPGIRRVVKLLRDNGFDTSDSGDGVTNVELGMEDALEMPHVHVDLGCDSGAGDDCGLCVKAHAEAARMRDLLTTNSESTFDVQLVYSPIDHRHILSVYGVSDSDLRKP